MFIGLTFFLFFRGCLRVCKSYVLVIKNIYMCKCVSMCVCMCPCIVTVLYAKKKKKFDRHTHTKGERNRNQTVVKKFSSFSFELAYRTAPRTFRLALRGYSVALLPRALRSRKFLKKKVCLDQLKML